MSRNYIIFSRLSDTYKKFLGIIFILFISLGYAQTKKEVFLFSYFINNGEDGLHLAYSEDGLKWKALNDNRSFLKPMVGEDKLMRDPCIIKGGDGKFHMVWTVSWNERGIGYASSDDLIHWSVQKYIPVMEHEPNARNCWAPELFYDADSDQYLIVWATTIPDRFPETDKSGDNGYNHRLYYITTKDFNSFNTSQLFFDPGFNVIDGTIQKIDGVYTLFFKNEILKPKAEKNILIATSKNFLGAYSNLSKPITKNWVEGPSVINTKRGWVVYFDRYTKHKMGAVISSDLHNWTNISNKISFPKGTRHGTVFKVKEKTLDKILEFQSQNNE